MKKILALILAMMMVLGLFAACGTENTSTPTTEAATNNEGTEGTEASAAFETIEAGKLIMSTNAEFPPYEMR